MRRLVRSSAVLCALLVLPTLVAAQGVPRELVGLDAYIEQAMREWEVPGLSIAVVRGDSVIYERGFGVRELGRPERVDENTLFAIASTTKALTVGVLGTLVDERRIRWDDPVSRHLPEYELSDPDLTRTLTVRDLLTHRTGVSRSDNLWIAGPFERAEVLHRARFLPVVDGFRESYAYNNVMFIAAGELAAAVAGRSWDDLVAERIFQPLGMTRSTTRMDVLATRDNVAASHTRVAGEIEAVPRRDYDNIGGAGAAFSSAHDMAQWVRLHLNGGTYNGRRILAEATVREMHTPQMIMRSDTVAARMFPTSHFRAYGLGWFLQDYHGRKIVHHSGTLNWTRTQVGFIPGEGIGIVAIANQGSGNLQLALMYRVFDALLGLPQRDWSAEYRELVTRNEVPGTTAPANTGSDRLTGTQPSLKLEDYAGRYTSDIYGDVQVSLANGRLVLNYAPDYIAELEHWHLDTFRGTWRRRGFGRAFVTFSIDRRARVASLELEGFGEFRRAGQE